MFTDEAIHACLKHGNGQLRVVSSTGDCKRNETALSWNRRGPVGEKGAAGEKGEAGPPGPPLEPDAGAAAGGARPHRRLVGRRV